MGREASASGLELVLEPCIVDNQPAILVLGVSANWLLFEGEYFLRQYRVVMLDARGDAVSRLLAERPVIDTALRLD